MSEPSSTVTTDAGPCRYCGLFHSLSMICPSIEKIEYYGNGAIKAITMKRTSSSEPKEQEKP